MGALRIHPKIGQRVLIADHDIMFARRMADYMWDHGIEARAVQSVNEARMTVRDWRPHSVFVGANFGETGAISLVRFMNSDVVVAKPKVIVMGKSHSRSSIEEMKREGVHQILLKPFPLEDVLRALEEPKAVSKVSTRKPGATNSLKELHLLNLILKQATHGQEEGRLFNLLRMINIKVQAVRTSLIECVDAHVGLVTASNDDEKIGGHRLQLDKYPEIQRVRTSGKPLIIPNMRTSDILAPVQASLMNLPFETVVLFPVMRNGEFYGVLSLRMEQKDAVELFYIEKFGQVCAQILALSIHFPEHDVFQE